MAVLTKPKSRELKTSAIFTRADLALDTWDEKTNSCEVVMSTGAAVIRAPWFDDPWIEELSMESSAVRMGRLESGRMGVIDSHGTWSISDQFGVCRDGALRDGKLVCRAVFSKNPDHAGKIADIRAGIISNVSIGYRVHKWLDVTVPDVDKMRRLRAIDWEPFELSFVVCPADAEAGTRAAFCPTDLDPRLQTRGPDPFTVSVIEGPAPRAPMDPETNPVRGGTATQPAPAPAAPQPQRTETPATPAPPAPAPDPKALKTLERARVAEIDRLAATPGLGEAWAKEQRALENTIEDVRAAALERLALRTDKPDVSSHVRTGEEGVDKVSTLISTALEARVGVIKDADPRLTPEVRRFRHMPIKRLAEEFLNARGFDCWKVSANEFYELALKGETRSGPYAGSRAMSGLMGTTDFAGLLGNVQNKAMRTAFELQTPNWMPLARRTEAKDFKPLKRIQLGTGSSMKLVNEHGQVEHGKFSEQSESYSINSYGIIYGLTRRAFVNDDLGEFDRIGVMMARQTTILRNNLIWALITGNVVMADGLAWFHTTHGNLLSGGGSVLGITGLSNARAAMRKFVDIDGNLLNMNPNMMVVPAALETTAQQLTTTLVPNLVTSPNPFAGQFKNVIVEPRLDAMANGTTAWYLFSDQGDIIEYAELSGQNGPTVATRNGFEVDGVEFRVLDDFGAAPLEYITAIKSVGV